MDTKTLGYFTQKTVLSRFLLSLQRLSYTAPRDARTWADDGRIVTGLKVVNNILCQQQPALLRAFTSPEVNGPRLMISLCRSWHTRTRLAASPSEAISPHVGFVHWRVMFLAGAGACHLISPQVRAEIYTLCEEVAISLASQLESAILSPRQDRTRVFGLAKIQNEVLRLAHALFRHSDRTPIEQSVLIHTACRTVIALHESHKQVSAHANRLASFQSSDALAECALAAATMPELVTHPLYWAACPIRNPEWCTRLGEALRWTCALHTMRDGWEFERVPFLSCLAAIHDILDAHPNALGWLQGTFLPSNPIPHDKKVIYSSDITSTQLEFSLIRNMMVSDAGDLREAVGNLLYTLCGGTEQFLRLCGMEFGGGYLANHGLLPGT